MLTLTEDQRWLLFGVGGWQMIHCLGAPESGIPHLMQSMWGSTNGRRGEDSSPEWLSRGFQCGHGKIVSPCHSDEPERCRVTVAQLKAFARTLSPETVAELRALGCESTRNAIRSGTHCHCGRSDAECAAYWGPASGERIHPTPEQAAEVRAEYWDIRRRENALLLSVLGLDRTDAPVQLDLFAEAAA